MTDTASAPGTWNPDAPLPRPTPGGGHLISGTAAGDATTQVRRRRRDGVPETVVSVLVERDPDEVDIHPPAATVLCYFRGPAAAVEHAALLRKGDRVRAVGHHFLRIPVRFGGDVRRITLFCAELGPARVH